MVATSCSEGVRSLTLSALAGGLIRPIQALISFIILCGILFWFYVKRVQAPFSEHAADIILTTFYRRIIISNTGLLFIRVIVLLFFPEVNNLFRAIIFSSLYTFPELCSWFFTIFLLGQKGCGKKAIKNALITTVIYSACMTTTYVWQLRDQEEDEMLFALSLLVPGTFSILVIMSVLLNQLITLKEGISSIFGKPESGVGGRLKALFIATVWPTFAFSIFVVSGLLLLLNNHDGNCFMLVGIVFSDLLYPFFLYYSLRTDAKYWRGLGLRTGLGTTFDYQLLPDDGLNTSINTTTTTTSSSPSSSSSSEQYMSGVAGNMKRISGYKEINIEMIMTRRTTIFDPIRFQILSKIGEGSTAEVYKVTYKGGNKAFALKQFTCESLSSSEIWDFCKEVWISHELTHRNIVRLYGVSIEPPTIGIVLEYCSEGSLKTLLKSNPFLPFSTKLAISIDIAHGLEVLFQ